MANTKILTNLTQFAFSMLYLSILFFRFGRFHLRTLWREWQMGNNPAILDALPSSSCPGGDENGTTVRTKVSSFRRPPRRRIENSEYPMHGREQFTRYNRGMVDILATITEEPEEYVMKPKVICLKM